MSIQDWGSMGELVAGIATLITLIYLAMQIRQNTQSQRAAAFQESNSSLNELNQLLARDVSAARIYRIGTSLEESLTVDEQMQFDMMILSLFRVYENMHFQYTHGSETELWSFIGRDISIVMTQSGMKNWWVNNPYSFAPEFTKFVESKIPRVNQEDFQNAP